jgi:hypothetical protein
MKYLINYFYFSASKSGDTKLVKCMPVALVSMLNVSWELKNSTLVRPYIPWIH